MLDNCTGHPDEDKLKSKDKFVSVMFLAPLLQPMDQNVIQNVKMQYKKN